MKQGGRAISTLGSAIWPKTKSFCAKMAGWFLVWGFVGQLGTSFDIPPEAEARSLPFSGYALADFDGDARPDFVLGHFERGKYRIKVHLSRRPSETSLSASGHGLGITLLALDVNQDAHADLVVASAHLGCPLAVWLNDGRGSFRRGKARRWTFWLSHTAGYTTAPTLGQAVFRNAEDRWPFTGPPQASLGRAPAFSRLLPSESGHLPQTLLSIFSLNRSPPD